MTEVLAEEARANLMRLIPLGTLGKPDHVADAYASWLHRQPLISPVRSYRLMVVWQSNQVNKMF